MYDFTTHHDRSQAGSYKWNGAKKLDPCFSSEYVPLSVADMELATAPEIVAGLKHYLDTQILGYAGPTQGYYEAVQEWMRKRHSFDIEREEIINTTGVVSAFYNAVRVFTHKGDGVIIMPPVYYPFYKAIEAAGCTLISCPLQECEGRYGIDFGHLEECAKRSDAKVILFCSPHNPVGRVWTRGELERLGEIALRNNLILLSDEIHADLCMPGHRHCVLQTLSEELAQRCLTLTSATKSFNLAGLALSNIIIRNRDLREQFKAGLQAIAAHPFSGPAYEATRLAYSEAGAWLDAVIGLVHSNYQILVQFIAQHLPQLRVFPLEGTYLVWVDERALGLDHEALEAMHLGAHLYLDEGYIFGEVGRGFSRINLAVPSDILVGALHRLELAVRAL